MEAPEDVHRYACYCGEVVLEVAGPSWLAWDLARARAIEHSRTCELGQGAWQHEVPASE